MREVVIVPTYKRSEMLYCCLEAIRVADSEIPIRVFPDRGTDESAICEKFYASQQLTVPTTYHGNSYNVLEALKWAYGQQYERVFIVEDDAIVDPTFFSWARAALDKDHDDLFAACGWQYSPNALIGEGPDLMIPWYLSVCACIPRRSLYGIVQHARPEYYSNMQSYLDRAYPGSPRRGSMHYEQDGLVLRVCESESKRCIWPRRPRATHIGFHGYHMDGKAPEGTLEERVAVIKLALANPAMLRALMSGGVTPNVDKCGGCGQPLLTEDKNARVECVTCFHAAHPGLERVAPSHYYLPR